MGCAAKYPVTNGLLQQSLVNLLCEYVYGSLLNAERGLRNSSTVAEGRASPQQAWVTAVDFRVGCLVGSLRVSLGQNFSFAYGNVEVPASRRFPVHSEREMVFRGISSRSTGTQDNDLIVLGFGRCSRTKRKRAARRFASHITSSNHQVASAVAPFHPSVCMKRMWRGLSGSVAGVDRETFLPFFEKAVRSGWALQLRQKLTTLVSKWTVLPPWAAGLRRGSAVSGDVLAAQRTKAIEKCTFGNERRSTAALRTVVSIGQASALTGESGREVVNDGSIPCCVTTARPIPSVPAAEFPAISLPSSNHPHAPSQPIHSSLKTPRKAPRPACSLSLLLRTSIHRVVPPGVCSRAAGGVPLFSFIISRLHQPPSDNR